jgi:hypothetical protein
MDGQGDKDRIIVIIIAVLVIFACSSENDYKIIEKHWMHYDYRAYEGYVLNDNDFDCIGNDTLDTVKNIDCSFISYGHDIDRLLKNFESKDVVILKSDKVIYNDESIDYAVISVIEQYYDRTIILSSKAGVIFDSYHHAYIRELDSLKYSVNGETAIISTRELLNTIIVDADLWKDPPGPRDKDHQ